MSPLRLHDHLAELETEIVSLESEFVEAQRTASDLVGDELACQLAEADAMVARTRLDLRYKQYFEISRELRRRRCAVHGDALTPTCPDCSNVIPLERGLDLSARLLDEAKEIGVTAHQALRIARWMVELSEDDRAVLVRTAARVARRTG